MMEALRRFKDFVKTRRFLALFVAVPSTILLFQPTLTSLLSPVLLLSRFSVGGMFVSFVLLAGGMSLAAVLVLSWAWIVTGGVPFVRAKGRRVFFFTLLCLGDLLLYYFAGVHLGNSSWTGLFFLAGAGCLSYALKRLARAEGSA